MKYNGTMRCNICGSEMKKVYSQPVPTCDRKRAAPITLWLCETCKKFESD
jgi:uncharacterized protein with PIN domain